MNALTLISSSMRLIGALASGETPTNAESQDALMVLNGMLDSWTAERDTVFTITIATFPLTVNQQVYGYGIGGDFNAPRPARIDRVSIVSLTNPNQPLELPLDIYTDWDWQQQPVKNIQTTLPQAVYIDNSYPLNHISYWPIPTQAVNTIIYGWTALSQFPDLVTDINFPPGYMEALRYNLAVRLIAEFPAEYSQVMVQSTAQLAVESLARIRSMNIPLVEAFCDAALTAKNVRYNYYSDMPVGGRNQ